MPDDDHGDDRNITNDDFAAAGEAMEISAEDARRNALDLLDDVDLNNGQLRS